MEGCILSLCIICTVVRVFFSAIADQDDFRFDSRVNWCWKSGCYNNLCRGYLLVNVTEWYRYNKFTPSNTIFINGVIFCVFIIHAVNITKRFKKDKVILNKLYKLNVQKVLIGWNPTKLRTSTSSSSFHKDNNGSCLNTTFIVFLIKKQQSHMLP